MLVFEIWYSHSADEKHGAVEWICGFSRRNPVRQVGQKQPGVQSEFSRVAPGLP